jgi:hypothetical protein
MLITWIESQRNLNEKIKNSSEVKFDLNAKEFDLIRRLTMPLRVQMKCLTFGMLQLPSNDFSAIKLQYTSHDGALIFAFVS